MRFYFNRLLVLCFVLWGGSQPVCAQLFKQDFNHSTSLAEYVHATAPDASQFNALGVFPGASGTSGVQVTIHDQRLRIARSQSGSEWGTGFFVRSTDIGQQTGYLSLSFSLRVSNISNIGNSQAQLYIGDGFLPDGTLEPHARACLRMGISFTGTSGAYTYALRDVPAGITGDHHYTGEHIVTMYVNGSATNQEYVAPDGSVQTIERGRWNVWVGHEKQFRRDRPMITPSVSPRNFKFVSTGSATAIYEIDDWTITEHSARPAYVTMNPDGSLNYYADLKGNTIPDFSGVGYEAGRVPIPDVAVVKTISPAASGSSQAIIQTAIDELSELPPDESGFRGAILLESGTYEIPGTIDITKSGIVLRGQGDEGANATRLIATGMGQRNLLNIAGTGSRAEIPGTRVSIADKYVPVGATSFQVENVAGFEPGDEIIVFRPGTQAWIDDLQMNAIPGANPGEDWLPSQYHLYYEREITRIEGNTIHIDNPIVMQMEEQYGGGEVYKYTHDGRISHVGVEDIYFESEYTSDTDEDHGWNAISFGVVQHGWARRITSRYFGNACVNMTGSSKYITVEQAKSFDPKSQITGSRRYTFNMAGRSQLNLVKDCYAHQGRHDYVTGARNAGPNVFYNSVSEDARSDNGPHQRWATGTLFDNITTDRDINVQDRGSSGSSGNGHGWAGVTQVLWNCVAETVTVQSPWVSGKNYSIGTIATKRAGVFYQNRFDGEWDSHNEHVMPASLYQAQFSHRQAMLHESAILVGFEGEKQSDNTVKLSWTTSQQDDLSHFSLYRSKDQSYWVQVESIQAAGAPTNYSSIDPDPLSGDSFYKLHWWSATGKASESPVLKINDAVNGTNSIFSQHFDQAAFLTSYINPVSPNNGQFDAAGVMPGKEGSLGVTATIHDRSFRIRRNKPGSDYGTGFFVRTTGLAIPDEIIKVDMGISIKGIVNSGFNQCQLFIGESFSLDGHQESNGNLFARVGINFSGGPGLDTYAVRDVTAGENGNGIYLGKHQITIYMNPTATDLDYEGPDANQYTLKAGKWNIWVGNTKQFSTDRNAVNAAVLPKNFKFICTEGRSIVDIAHFEMNALNRRSPEENAPEEIPVIAGDVVVSKALSPNGDGINDILMLKGINAYPENELVIFTHTGRVVFSIQGYDNETKYFEGVSDGKRLPADTYYYMLKFREKDRWRQKKGFFVIRY